MNLVNEAVLSRVKEAGLGALGIGGSTVPLNSTGFVSNPIIGEFLYTDLIQILAATLTAILIIKNLYSFFKWLKKRKSQ